MKTFDEWKNICASNSKAPVMIVVGKATVWVAFVTIHDHLPVMKLSSRMLLQSAFLSIRNGWELILRNALPFTVDLIVRCSRHEVSVVLYANLNSSSFTAVAEKIFHAQEHLSPMIFITISSNSDNREEERCGTFPFTISN